MAIIRAGCKNPIDWNDIINWKEQLISMYRDGNSLNKLAMHFNTSPNSIKNKLIELGIPIRGKEEAHILEANKRYGK